MCHCYATGITLGSGNKKIEKNMDITLLAAHEDVLFEISWDFRMQESVNGTLNFSC